MHLNLMGRAGPSTTTETSTKASSQRDKGAAMEHTGLTKSTSTLVNGNITVFGGKAKSSETMKCFLKAISKRA